MRPGERIGGFVLGRELEKGDGLAARPGKGPPHQLEVWDMEHGVRRLACASDFGALLVSVAISADGRRIAAATAANEVYLLDLLDRAVEGAVWSGSARVVGPVKRMWFEGATLQVGLGTGAIELAPP